MNITIFALPSVESGSVSSATLGIDFESIEFTPSCHLGGVYVHLDGEDALCAHLLKAIIDALEPGVIVRSGIRCVVTDAAKLSVVGAGNETDNLDGFVSHDEET